MYQIREKKIKGGIDDEIQKQIKIKNLCKETITRLEAEISNTDWIIRLLNVVKKAKFDFQPYDEWLRDNLGFGYERYRTLLKDGAKLKPEEIARIILLEEKL